MNDISASWPELHFPEGEAKAVEKYYNEADVILEYGSGGSTVLAASLHDKLVFSVESDELWAYRLQSKIDAANMPSPTIVKYVDIGPTGAWGRPVNTDAWEKFWTYPAAIWDEPFFRHPDVVLIDGRFRTACFMTTLVKMKRPVTILFDDYAKRRRYHDVEKFCKPQKVIGRMAIFQPRPGLISPEQLSSFIDLLNRASYSEAKA